MVLWLINKTDTEKMCSMKPGETRFPFGQIGLYTAVLFWVLGFMTGSVGVYDARPSGPAAALCLVLLAGALVCGGIGLFRPGIRNKALSGVTLVILLLPLALLLMKS